MGIFKLMSLIQDKAPGAVRQVDLKLYSGRIIACDASMAIYQFIIATQGYSNQAFSLTELTDKEGNKTGHLVGLFNRSILFLENGIKPIWVFDGKPPQFKSGELARRKKQKQEALEKMEDAKESGDLEEQLKQKVRSTYVTPKMFQDAKNMLKLMGMPIIEAPCEAEATCSKLCQDNKVYATATEDLDALTFGTNILLRGFNSKKEPITEINYNQMLKEFDITRDEFVDLCILCGCDYTESIEGVGPVTAFKLIKEHKNIEKIYNLFKKIIYKEQKKKNMVFLKIFFMKNQDNYLIIQMQQTQMKLIFNLKNQMKKNQLNFQLMKKVLQNQEFYQDYQKQKINNHKEYKDLQNLFLENQL